MMSKVKENSIKKEKEGQFEIAKWNFGKLSLKLDNEGGGVKKYSDYNSHISR